MSTEIGRVLRPLIIVENGKSKLRDEHILLLEQDKISFNDLIKQGIIEYLDAAEEENCLVALEKDKLTEEHTHLEIDEIDFLGLVTSLVPYGNHDQSSRLNRGSKTQKQALGLYAANFLCRLDTDVSILHYPQKPLVRSFVYDTLDIYPAGQNLVVAVMCHEGYNLEDALVLNKASVERGLARSTYFRPYTSTELNYPGGLKDEITVPKKDTSGYRTEESYRFLEDDGIVYPEAKLKEGEVVIGKVSPPRFFTAYEYTVGAGLTRQDASVTVRHAERGVVDVVMMTTDNEGNKLVKVRVRDLRIPELGDKFASRHGQKGVLGLLIPQYDMPFTEEGIVPDLIINPHAFPSRMTVGQLIESIAGKAAALDGRLVNATPFYKEPPQNLMIVLKRYGYLPTGEESMYDGRTGELLRTPIFIGIIYYQKLHHMVADKIHARATGPVQILTRQPTEGRSRQGGLRWGEMEVDCLVGHGASYLLKEAMVDRSDRALIHVCELCGHIGWYDRNKGVYVCPVHGDKGKLRPIEVSYAFKLLVQELMSMCIMPRLKLGDVRRM